MNDYRPPVTIGADVHVPEPFLKGPSAPVQQTVEETQAEEHKRPPMTPTPGGQAGGPLPEGTTEGAGAPGNVSGDGSAAGGPAI
jgi:hypothetical protein